MNLFFYVTLQMFQGAWGHALRSSQNFKSSIYFRSTELLFGRCLDRFPVVSVGIFSVAPPHGTVCLGVDSVSENEYQGFLLG